MIETHAKDVTDEDLRRAVEMDRAANARANAEWRLRLAGHTATPKNRAILDILEETRGQHPTARDIFEQLRKRHPAAILNSVYPVLHALEGAGLVQSRRFGRLPMRYDVRVDDHIDVLCACGAVEEIEESPEVETEPTRGAVRAGTVRAGDTRRGLCRACSAEAAASAEGAA